MAGKTSRRRSTPCPPRPNPAMNIPPLSGNRSSRPPRRGRRSSFGRLMILRNAIVTCLTAFLIARTGCFPAETRYRLDEEPSRIMLALHSYKSEHGKFPKGGSTSIFRALTAAAGLPRSGSDPVAVVMDRRVAFDLPGDRAPVPPETPCDLGDLDVGSPHCGVRVARHFACLDLTHITNMSHFGSESQHEYNEGRRTRTKARTGSCQRSAAT